MINIDSIIVVFVVTLVVGIFAGRNVRSLRDFSVSAKIFPTTVLVSTIFSTWIGGDDLIGVSKRIYGVGLVFFVISLGHCVSLFLHAYIIAPRVIRDFTNKISVSEIMKELYGKPGQVVSGVANVLFSVAYAVMGDVIAVLWPSKISDKSELMLSRIVTVLFGITSMYVATMFSCMIDFGIYFSNFWTPTVVAPMFLYLFNFKTDIKTYLISVAIGFTAIIFFRYSVPEDYTIVSQIFGALVTFSVMFILGKHFGCLSRPYDSALVFNRV